MKNKQAVTWVVLVVVVLLVGLYAGKTYFSTTGQEETIPGVPSNGDTGFSCDVSTAPTLNVAVRDAENTGTSVTTDVLYSVNGLYYSTTPTFAIRDKVQVIANQTSYIDVASEVKTLKCGTNTVALEMFDYSAPTVEIKEDNTVLTDSAVYGANNGSIITSGGSNTLTLCITGTDKDSTGDMIFVVETSLNANVSTVNLYRNGVSATTVDVPGFYADTLTSPFKKAFKIPAIVGAQEVCYDMTIVAKSGKTIVGEMYTTFYVGEPFFDTDGSFNEFGVEDANDEVNYEATFDYDITMDS